MKYYFTKTISRAFDETVKLITDGLKNEGFGLIFEIRLHEKLKEKFKIDFKKYAILGANNPDFALKALQLADKVGTKLPCNLLVIDQGNGMTEVAAINPVASMQSISNPELYDVIHKIARKLRNIVDSI